MLQQTQIATFLTYFERWMQALPDFEALARARAMRLEGDLRRAELPRVPLAVVDDEAPDPVSVRLLCARAQMTGAGGDV